MSENVTMPREKHLGMMRDNSRKQVVSMVDQVLDGVLEVLTMAATERVSMWEFIARFPEFQRDMVFGIEDNFDAKWDAAVKAEKRKADG